MEEATLNVRHVVVRPAAWFGMDDNQDASQCRFRKLHVEFAGTALEGLHQYVLHALAQGGVIIFARRVDQAGEKATESVVTDEEACALALAEAEYAHCSRIERLNLDLKQFIARVLFEDDAQRPAAVALRLEFGALKHLGDLAAEQWNSFRAGAVGGGGK